MKTFPIKKRIDTELFIVGKKRLFIQKRKEGSDQKDLGSRKYRTSGKRVNLKRRETKLWE